MKRVALSGATLAVALCLGIIQPTFGQVNAVVGGTVADPSSAFMPGVVVTAKNVNTGIVSTRMTNESGNYEFPSLQPGTYTITAALGGFQTEVFNNVQLGQGQQVRLNFTLQLATGAQTVEIVAEADTALATTSASVGGVLAEKEVLSLPVQSRNVLDLVSLTPGVITVPGVFVASTLAFAGTQQNDINTTRDGMVTSDGRYANGAYSSIFTSPDMVEEVRVNTNSVDATLGRGIAQVQMRTRGGSNEFHGALFYTNNNSKFNTQSYFQNLTGAAHDYANRNQFGGRVGGPIKKNKAFFFVLLDDQRYLEKVTTTAVVLTAPARQGVFRYLTAGAPGGTTRKNGNAFSTTPSVDLNGNILTTDATGAPLFVNSYNLFTTVKDPNRTHLDPVWFGPQYINNYMPLPNDYTVGDGLNTAGYRWQQPHNGFDGATGQSPNTNRNHITARFDYQINDKNKVNFVFTKEHDWGVAGQTGLPDYPAGYFGDINRRPDFYTASWTSTVTASLLNEFRFGLKRDTWEGTSPLDLGCCFNGNSETTLSDGSKAARASYPQANGSFLYTQAGTIGGSTMGLYAGMNVSSPRLTKSPFTQIADTLSWNKNAHAFQFGFEIDRTNSRSSNSGGTQTTRPFVTLGNNPAAPVPNVNSTTFPGLNALDVTTAQDLLANLAGSVNTIQQQYWVNSPTQKDWSNYTQDFLFYRDNHQNEWSGFAKDSWKVTRNLTVNLGLRYDFVGTPYEGAGLAGRFVGGQAGLFGISGKDFNALWNPYATGGSLSVTEFVGNNSPNPGKLVYNNDWNNFAPSIGAAWNLPWFKKSTILRAGYGINYRGNVDFLAINTNIGNFPGQTLNTANPVSSYVDLTTVGSLIPVSTGGVQPFAPVALTNRSAGITGYTDNLRVPYIQTFNVSIQHELTSSLTFDLNYIGNKGTRLYTTQQLNDVNIFENGFLDAFNTTRAGGNAALFDQLLMNVNVPGVGVVNGTTLTGSQALRRYTSTNQFIANGSVGALANFFNTTTAFASSGFGAPGDVLRKHGLPENFFVVNPQFGSVGMVNNNGNSTYNSFQAHIAKRYAHGLTGQFAYTFSKTLGDNLIRDQRNLQLSKGLLSIDRPHLFQGNVTYDLPFGSKRAFLGSSPKWVDQIVGGWQVSSSFSWVSGQLLSFTATGNNTLNFRGTDTADLVGQLPSDYQQVVKGNGFVQYFPGMTVKTAPTPNFGGDATLPTRFTNFVVVDNSGNIVLANPNPGKTGNTAAYFPGLRAPGLLGFHATINKTFRITESKTISLRADAINLLNTPQFGYSTTSGLIGINTNINSTSFGRITSASGQRTITFYARFDF
jgi:hypothetical protein